MKIKHTSERKTVFRNNRKPQSEKNYSAISEGQILRLENGAQLLGALSKTLKETLERTGPIGIDLVTIADEAVEEILRITEQHSDRAPSEVLRPNRLATEASDKSPHGIGVVETKIELDRGLGLRP